MTRTSAMSTKVVATAKLLVSTVSGPAGAAAFGDGMPVALVYRGLEADIARDSPAIGPVEDPALREFLEVAPRGLRRDAEAFRKLRDADGRAAGELGHNLLVT